MKYKLSIALILVFIIELTVFYVFVPQKKDIVGTNLESKIGTNKFESLKNAYNKITDNSIENSSYRNQSYMKGGNNSYSIIIDDITSGFSYQIRDNNETITINCLDKKNQLRQNDNECYTHTLPYTRSGS